MINSINLKYNCMEQKGFFFSVWVVLNVLYLILSLIGVSGFVLLTNPLPSTHTQTAFNLFAGCAVVFWIALNYFLVLTFINKSIK